MSFCISRGYASKIARATDLNFFKIMCGILEKWKCNWSHINVGRGCVKGEIV